MFPGGLRTIDVKIVAMPDLIGTKKIFAVCKPTKKENAMTTAVNLPPSLYDGLVIARKR